MTPTNNNINSNIFFDLNFTNETALQSCLHEVNKNENQNQKSDKSSSDDSVHSLSEKVDHVAGEAMERSAKYPDTASEPLDIELYLKLQESPRTKKTADISENSSFCFNTPSPKGKKRTMSEKKNDVKEKIKIFQQIKETAEDTPTCKSANETIHVLKEKLRYLNNPMTPDRQTDIEAENKTRQKYQKLTRESYQKPVTFTPKIDKSQSPKTRLETMKKRYLYSIKQVEKLKNPLTQFGTKGKRTE